jgi:hypothetical protein
MFNGRMKAWFMSFSDENVSDVNMGPFKNMAKIAMKDRVPDSIWFSVKLLKNMPIAVNNSPARRM